MEFTQSGGNKNANITLEQLQEGSILYVTVKMTLQAPEIPEPFRIFWKWKDVDCYSVWSPSIRRGRSLGPAWGKRKTDSRLSSWMPLHQLVSLSGQNRLNIAVSDCAIPIRIATGICEEDACFDCEVEFFTIPTAPISTYTAVIRLDMRDIPYYDSIYDTVAWWERDCGYHPAHVPEAARLPMDSLWYSYHQVLDQESIVRECSLSKKLGMKTVIIDDGWQTDDNSRGYAHCGDWKPTEKEMGDMAELVRRIHAEGMKVILWYSVPFVGIYTEKYEEFRDMLLDQTGNNSTFWALDPRYKKVRDYLTGIYTDAVTNWGLDGLKLDFIDSFFLKGKSLEEDPKRDYTSLEEAVDVLLTEVKSRLTAINPDILIDFRQSYVGPSIRKYGNMLRVGDCPNDAIQNRGDIVNLRFTSGRTAVHSDMIMWNVEDRVESAALQFAHILYSVPQISMRIEELPEDHYRMLAYYLSFWLEWREVLLDGKLTAKNPETEYSIVCSALGDRAVFTAYTDKVVELGTREAAAVNATGSKTLIIKNAAGKKYRTVNCMGEEVASGTIAGALEELEVPVAGMIFVA